MKNKDVKKAFIAAFPNTIPVLTGFIMLGMAYGILMQTKGYSVIWAAFTSIIVFAGSLQFVAISLFVSAFNPLQAFLLSIMVNARHIFYGISLLDKYKGMGKIKPFLIYTMCDETFSIVSSVEPPQNISRKLFYFFISLLDYLYWLTGTVLGCIFGNFIKFNTEGLDFVLTALFLVLFVEQMKSKENIIASIIGVIASIVSIMLFGADNMVIPAMIIILIVLLGGRNKICISQQDKQ